VVRPQLQALYASYFTDNGVAAMLFPTTVLPARPIGQDQSVELNGRQVNTFTTYIRNTDADAVAGIPASRCRGRTRSGLPVGMELDGPWAATVFCSALGSPRGVRLSPASGPEAGHRENGER